MFILAACGYFTGFSGKTVEKKIGREAADGALAELSGLQYETSFSKEADIDGVKCYLYTAVKDEKASEQLLAVNAISGEVMAYDPAKKKLIPIDRSDFASEEEDYPVSWDGEYGNSTYLLVLMPADDNSFEFEITKQGEKESLFYDFAQVKDGKKNEALCETDGATVTFKHGKDSIEVQGTGEAAAFSGTYTFKE